MIPRTRNSIETKVLRDIIEHCSSESVRVCFDRRYNIGVKRLQTSGTFDGREIRIATNNSKWFEVLIHEYAHFLQKLDGASWFTEAREDRMWWTFDAWVLGRSNPKPERIRECARIIAECELDAERRAVKLIKRYQIPSISIEDYVKAANAYVLSYEAVRVFRKWPRRSVYRVASIWKALPSRFISRSRVNKLPPGFLEAFAKHCV